MCCRKPFTFFFVYSRNKFYLQSIEECIVQLFVAELLEFVNQEARFDLPVYVIIAALYVVINWGLGALARVIEARTR